MDESSAIKYAWMHAQGLRLFKIHWDRGHMIMDNLTHFPYWITIT